MIKILLSRAMFLLLMVFVPLASAVSLVPQPPTLASAAYFLIDSDSGFVIASKNADKVLPPASLTKMMTAYVLAYELHAGNVTLQDKVRISEKAWRTEGSRMFIQEGKEVVLENLMRGVIIQSGNDASVAVAEYLAGSEGAFVGLMNKHALRLGMLNTNFENSTGLPSDNHYSTPRDLATLSRAIINDFPEHYPMYSEKEFTFNNIRQPNRNKLLWRDNSVDGLKTGHTSEAGYCLVASAKKNGQRLISVVMGASDVEARTQESQHLLAYGMRFFETHTLYNVNELIRQERVWGGQADLVGLTVAEDVIVTVPRGQAENLKAEIVINTDVEAPIEKGQMLGTLTIKLAEEVISEHPLSALNPINKGGFGKRAIDSLTRMVQGIIN